MGTGTNEVQVVAIDLVDQQPIGFDVAVAKVPPLTAERMGFVARGQRTVCRKELDHLTQLCHVLAAFFRELHIPPKLRSAYQVAQGLDVQVFEQSTGRLEALSLASIGGLQSLHGGRVGYLDVKGQRA